MKILIKILLCLLLLTSTAAKADDEQLQIFKLDNGHTVIIKEVHSNPIVTVDTWVKTGSVNETPDNNGVSHFLEHLLFKGTKNYKNGEIERILESKGARFNAGTSKEFTHYYVTIANNQAETAIKLLSEMLFKAVIPTEELNKERDVVQEEIRRSEDNYRRTLHYNLNDMLFKKHPYKYKVLGTDEIIENIPRKAILDYYHTHYVPQNMTTIVVGDVNTENILKLIKENYKTAINFKYKKLKFKREPSISEKTEKVEKGNYNMGYMEIGYKAVPIDAIKENYALDLAASILGDGKSSRLYKVLKEDKNLVSSIGTGHLSMKDDSVFIITADFSPQNYEEVKKTIFDEIEKIKNEEVTEEELDRAKTLAKRNYIYSNESVENIASSIGYCMSIAEDINCYKKHLEYLDNITAKDIQKAVNKYLNNDKAAISTLLPETTPVNNTVKCKKVVKNTTKTVLSNGATLISNKTTHNDIVAMSVFVKGGKFTEPIPGTGLILSDTIKMGTKNRTNEQIIKETENNGIVIAPAVSADYFEIKLKSTKTDFNNALDILLDIIKNPTFPEKYIEKTKKDILAGIQKSQDQPMAIAMDNFSNLMYFDHPYNNSQPVIKENIDKITRDTLINYHKNYFTPENMIISVSGNINPNEIAEKITAKLQASNSTPEPTSYSHDFKKFQTQRIKLESKDTKAAWIIMGWKTEGISDNREFATLRVIDSILSGGLSTRLHKKFREEEGLAYSVGSRYSPKIDSGDFNLYIGTNPQNTEHVINKFLEEIKLLKTQKVDKKELEEAKERLIGRFKLAKETNQSKAYYLGIFEVVDKGFEFNYDFPDLIKTITQEDIIKVANKYFNSPYALSIVAPKETIVKYQQKQFESLQSTNKQSIKK